MKRHPYSTTLVPACIEILEDRALLSAAVAVNPAAAFEKHSHQHRQILNQLSTSTPVTASTVPANGDVNPYGVAFVPEGFASGGTLKPGDLLVSNFNASSNQQGTGTTIVRITPDGHTSTFFQGNAGLGLTTAAWRSEKRIRNRWEPADYRRHQRHRAAGIAVDPRQKRKSGGHALRIPNCSTAPGTWLSMTTAATLRSSYPML